MSLATPLKMMGAPGSPYTRKMRAILRYRHIPYRLIYQGSPEHQSLPAPKIALLPTFYLPGDAGPETPTMIFCFTAMSLRTGCRAVDCPRAPRVAAPSAPTTTPPLHKTPTMRVRAPSLGRRCSPDTRGSRRRSTSKGR